VTEMTFCLGKTLGRSATVPGNENYTYLLGDQVKVAGGENICYIKKRKWGWPVPHIHGLQQFFLTEPKYHLKSNLLTWLATPWYCV